MYPPHQTRLGAKSVHFALRGFAAPGRFRRGFPKGGVFLQSPPGQLFGNFLSAQKVTPRRAGPQGGQLMRAQCGDTRYCPAPLGFVPLYAVFNLSKSQRYISVPFIVPNCTAEWSRPFPTLVRLKIGVLYALWQSPQTRSTVLPLSVWLVPRQPVYYV